MTVESHYLGLCVDTGLFSDVLPLAPTNPSSGPYFYSLLDSRCEVFVHPGGEKISYAHAKQPPPARPFPTFWRVKGHQASFHANKRREKKKKTVTDKSGILQILKFIVALLITAFKLALLPQSPDPIAVKSRRHQQSCSFKRARLIRILPEPSKAPIVHLSIFPIHSQRSAVGAGVILLSSTDHIQHSHACFWDSEQMFAVISYV